VGYIVTLVWKLVVIGMNKSTKKQVGTLVGTILHYTSQMLTENDSLSNVLDHVVSDGSLYACTKSPKSAIPEN